MPVVPSVYQLDHLRRSEDLLLSKVDEDQAQVGQVVVSRYQLQTRLAAVVRLESLLDLQLSKVVEL